MPSVSKPRSPPRATRTPPPISYSQRPSSQATITGPMSSKPKFHRGHSPSLSNPMHWLSRTATQTSGSPYSPSKPTRISEPKLARSIELLSNPRSGLLGAGATVVRTPADALRETGIRLTSERTSLKDQRSHVMDVSTSRPSSIQEEPADENKPSTQKVLPLSSPPLPPLPLPEDEESEFFAAEPQPSKQLLRHTDTPPLPSSSPSLRSSLKIRSVLSNEDVSPLPQVPPLPANMPSAPMPPPFRPILTSDIPTGAVDHSKIIVVLETCTTTHRTTLETLRSRPSYLSDYLSSLFPTSERASAVSSLYSTASDDLSTYRQHLTSQGLLPRTSYTIRIFLDRPSAPYSHILNYLRSLPSQDAQEALPRSVYQQPSSHLRLESLLELRDEATYLNLEGLHKLCVDEIRSRHGPRLHMRGQSTSTLASAHSLSASIYSLHTLLERVENDIKPNHRDSKSSHSSNGKNSPIELKSPPTPESMNGISRRRSESRCDPSRPPPAGWI